MQNYDNIKDRSVQPASSVPIQSNAGKYAIQLKDNRTDSKARKKLVDAITNKTSIQKKENKTGLPDELKSGIENLSGISMDDVNVHYHSDKPAQLSAHAYAQGTDIHIAPGQEKHLSHEAWHVVQQKQGRVKPTIQMKKNEALDDDNNPGKETTMISPELSQLKPSGDIVENPGLIMNNEVIQLTAITDSLDASDVDWNKVHNKMGEVNTNYSAYERRLKAMDNTHNEPVGAKAAQGVQHWADNFQNKSLAYLAEFETVMTRTQGARIATLGTNINTEPDIFITRMNDAPGLEQAVGPGQKDHLEIKRTEGDPDAIKDRTRDATHQLVARKSQDARNYIAEIHAPKWYPTQDTFANMSAWANQWATNHVDELKSPGGIGYGHLIIRIYYAQSTVPITASVSIY